MMKLEGKYEVYSKKFTSLYICLVRNIWEHHEDISSFVASQDIYGCIDSAKRKLKGILSLGDQLISDLPCAYLEIYEFLQIAKVNKYRRRISHNYTDRAWYCSWKIIAVAISFLISVHISDIKIRSWGLRALQIKGWGAGKKIRR